MNIVKFYVRKMLGLPVQYYYKSDRIPAATHLPVLLAMSRLFKIEHVLEFGAGKFSTINLLNRGLFPLVKSVHSYETDPEWKSRVELLAKGDSRLTIELIAPEVQRTAAVCDYVKYDLVLVDNGPYRPETIKEVVAHENKWKLVLVHDYENLPYQRASKAASHKYCFDAYCPHTAVLWNERKLGPGVRTKFRRMNKLLSQHVAEVEAGNVGFWADIIGKTADQTT